MVYSSREMFESGDYVAVKIHASIWDLTWILNKTAHLSEDYDVPVSIAIERSKSVECVIAAYIAGGIAASLVSHFGEDLYDYIKTQAKRASRRKKGKGKVDVETNEKWKKTDLPYQ